MKYEEVFCEELGTAKSMKATLTAMKKSHPHTVPFAIKDVIAREIERLEAAGVLEKVQFSQWATPIVPLPKKDGSFWLCVITRLPSTLHWWSIKIHCPNPKGSLLP